MTKQSTAGQARVRALAASYPADLHARILREAEATYGYWQRARRPRWLDAKLRMRTWLARHFQSIR